MQVIEPAVNFTQFPTSAGENIMRLVPIDWYRLGAMD
jgi:hypothetical protein